ncbi:MAG: nicotinamide mononucleotide transporter [Clostridiales bacterium]|nr:nicotinamide mononucleotide transporter [Clostridiales bacterium]
MILRNPFKTLARMEWLLWLLSITVIFSSFLLSGSFYLLTLIASMVGVTALIFVAKGDVWGQLLTVLFSLLYAVISLQFRYYGEMITYLGMTAPIAAMSVITWLRNLFADTDEVKVHELNKLQRFWLMALTIIVTIIFYFILKAFDTANLFISTVSIATSFSASYLMLFRSPNYALAYAANDIVLIILWVMAAMNDLSYLPMIACFAMFFVNDIYGFINWIRIKNRQQLQFHSSVELKN